MADDLAAVIATALSDYAALLRLHGAAGNVEALEHMPPVHEFIADRIRAWVGDPAQVERMAAAHMVEYYNYSDSWACLQQPDRKDHATAMRAAIAALFGAGR